MKRTEPIANALDRAANEGARAADAYPAPEAFSRDPRTVLDALAIWAQTGAGASADEVAAMAGPADALAARLGGPQAQPVFDALGRVLVAPHAGAAIMGAADVIARFIPVVAQMNGCPQHTPFHAYDVLEHTARVVDASPATVLSRWAGLFHDCGKPRCRRTDAAGRDHFKGHPIVGARIARESLQRLGAPAGLRKDICTLVELHERPIPATDAGLDATIAELGGDVALCRALLALQVADSRAKAPGIVKRGQTAQAALALLDARMGAR